MFRIDLAIHNPFYKDKGGTQIDYVECDRALTKNKNLEFQVSKSGDVWSLFDFDIDLTFRGTDHAGLRISMGAIGYFFVFSICDKRHWDDDNDCWETYPDKPKDDIEVDSGC